MDWGNDELVAVELNKELKFKQVRAVSLMTPMAIG
jgi:hypothetical protein